MATVADHAGELLSTRLFPKGRGADAYLSTGLAARCDWVVMSDRRPPFTILRAGGHERPRHIFLSMRNPGEALRFFADEILPRLDRNFVLVTGSGDATLPRQIDRRWPPFDAADRSRIARILDHPRLVRWFAENLDDASDPRLQPLPLGMVFDGAEAASGSRPAPLPAMATRPLRAICAHRLRDGAQWQTRRDVSALARTAWRDFCTVPDRETDAASFVMGLLEHAFVLCVEGGGLDPSPKAWLALLHGAIPIIRDGPLRAAYQYLPVVMIPEWSGATIDPGRLATWRKALSPWFDEPDGRREVLSRLGMDFWWQGVCRGHLPQAQGLAVIAEDARD